MTNQHTTYTPPCRADMSRPQPEWLTIPDHQANNDCYAPYRAYDHGYTDGRFFNGNRRPGAKPGRDRNYDLGLACGNLDRFELDA